MDAKALDGEDDALVNAEKAIPEARVYFLEFGNFGEDT